LLAKAVANETQANFITIKGPEIFSKWVGESEKAIRQIFKRAKQASPCIVFLDEIDALAPRRGFSIADTGVTERVVNQLLTSIDGLETLEGVVVIGATNRPDILDPAILRPGRFDRLLLTPLPDKDARFEILKVHTKNMPLENVDLKKLAEKLEGYAGADIESLCREAAMEALRTDQNADKVTEKHFEAALKTVKPSATAETMKYYERIKKELETGLEEKRKKEGILPYVR
jgi:transitional endoplasmic reticulum ATPase